MTVVKLKSGNYFVILSCQITTKIGFWELLKGLLAQHVVVYIIVFVKWRTSSLNVANLPSIVTNEEQDILRDSRHHVQKNEPIDDLQRSIKGRRG